MPGPLSAEIVRYPPSLVMCSKVFERVEDEPIPFDPEPATVAC